MARGLHIAVLFLPALLAAVLLHGCTKDELHEAAPIVEQTPKPAGTVYLRFRMNLPDGTRADASADPNIIDGTTGESAVRRVDLLVYDAESDKLADFIRLDEAQTVQITSASGVTVPVFAPQSNRARIYVSVNTPGDLADQFVIGRTGHDFIAASSQTNYWEVINAFVPGSDGKQELLESGSGGIPMTGQFTLSGSDVDVIDIAALTGTGTQTLLAKVERIVAKVHVLAKCREYVLTSEGDKKVFYCDAKASDAPTQATDAPEQGDAGWIGWIRLSDVRYMPNSMNRSTYLFPQTNASGAPMDPNMDLTSYIINGSNNLDAALCFQDYVYFTALDMHRENISPNYHLSQAEGLVMTATDSDPTPDPTKYTKGMYCLENYFDDPQGADPFAAMDYPLPMVTNISIVAKLTPRYIVLLTDYKRSMDNFVARSRSNVELYERKYGFTQEEADIWEEEIKPRYFYKYENGELVKDEYDNPVDREYPLFRGQYNIITVNTERDARYILSWSLKAREIWTADPADFDSDKWSDGTFYVYDTVWDEKAGVTVTDADKELWGQKYLYFAPGAVFGKAADSDDFVNNPTAIAARTYAVPHLCGWGYYYTYIGPPAETAETAAEPPTPALTSASASRTPYMGSKVTRNHYYLLKINNFGSPGGTITRPEYLKTNTEPVNWNYAGRGNIYLH